MLQVKIVDHHEESYGADEGQTIEQDCGLEGELIDGLEEEPHAHLVEEQVCEIVDVAFK